MGEEGAAIRKRGVLGPAEGWWRAHNLRVLVDELGAVVDLVVDYNVDVLLGVVLGNILVGEFNAHYDRFRRGKKGPG